MSWRDARAAALVLGLAGCGFHPLYAERSPLGYDPALASIDVRPAANGISDVTEEARATSRLGQITTQEVREEFNPRGVDLEKRYVLSMTVTEERSDLGIRRDNTSSRGELLIGAHIVLTPSGSETVLFQDSLRTLTAFDLSDDAYAASVAEDNAREEAATDLGREITLRIRLYLQRQAKGGT